MKKTILFSLLILCMVFAVGAREFVVESFEVQPNDLTARTNAVNDLNGNKCALIKVALPQSGGEFSGNVLKQEYHINEYLVYMSQGTKYLQLRYPGMETLMLDVTPYTDGRGLESGMTYRLKLSGYEDSSTGNSSQQNTVQGNYLILDITPNSEVMVEVDGNIYPVDNGQTSAFLDYGNHTLSVKAAGYAPYTGTVSIVPESKTTKSIQLESIQAKLNVNSATPGATIKINGRERGSGSFSESVIPGNYLIEVEKAGYRPYSTSVELRQKEERTVDIPSLQPIYSNLDVSYAPIGATIAIDGKTVGTTPDVIRDVLVGSHTVTISKDGYETVTLTANLIEDQPTKLSGELKKKEVNSPSVTNTTTTVTNLDGHEAVDLGLSVKWATCNVGAEKPSDYGNYYAWGETQTKFTYTNYNTITYGKSMKDIGGSTSDVANTEWGCRWRLPTKEEFQELVDKCKWEWTTIDGHKGYMVIGPNGNSIFLAAAGYRNGDSAYSVGSDGRFWSSTPSSNDRGAWNLYINDGLQGVDWHNRGYGYSVRPVVE